MEQLKKLMIAILVAVVIADVGILINAFNITEKTSKLLGAGISLDKYTLAGSTASTSPKYLSTASASTTAEIIMSVSNAKHIDLNILFTASTTASVLKWTNYFSYDEGSNKNWYPENGFTATSNILETEGATPLVHSWTPGVTSASYKNIGVNPVASKYMKTRFWTDVANGSLYVEGISQQEVN